MEEEPSSNKEGRKYYKRALHVYEIDVFDREIYQDDLKTKKRSKTGR